MKTIPFTFGRHEHRALNYLAMRYPAIYTTAGEQFGRNASLTGVEVQPSPLSGARRIVEGHFLLHPPRTSDHMNAPGFTAEASLEGLGQALSFDRQLSTGRDCPTGYCAPRMLRELPQGLWR